jgi:integrase
MAGLPLTLSDAITEFLAYRKTAGFRPNTLTVNARSLSYFLREVGNLQVKHLDARHGEMFQAWVMGKGFKPNTVNSHLSCLSAFTKWCRSRRYLGGGADPTANTRAIRVMLEPRTRIDPKDFAAFLDVCSTPLERIVVALGLFLFIRSSEITALRVKDVDLDRQEILVHVMKSQLVDVMPICQELDTELRRWLTWYSMDIQSPLEGEYYLVPQRRRRPLGNDGSGPGGGFMVFRPHNNCVPDHQLQRAHRYVQKPLAAFGVDLRGDDGKSTMEGVHTLRRSGARALFDQMVDEGSYDGVLRYVAAMLHHKTTVMTERYLGLDVDVKKRNDLLKGRRMFQTPASIIETSDNITTIRGA